MQNEDIYFEYFLCNVIFIFELQLCIKKITEMINPQQNLKKKSLLFLFNSRLNLAIIHLFKLGIYENL